MQEEQTTVTVGTMIRGRYLVKDLLGKSDSGAIYLVEDQRTHSNPFALKEVIVQSKHELYRSLLEYQLLVRLDHPALAHVHSLLKDDQRHRAYLLMEYIEGSNLETLRQQQPQQRFTWLETMNIMASIIAAVSYLHGHQPPIIHGDIKPTNIIMPKAGGRAILVDFGTAKRYDLDSRTGVINRARSVRSCYRAPEQYITGSDLQTDIYSLGATFYTLVTGIVPADAPFRLTQVSNGEIDPLQPINEVLPTIPARVARAINRAMSLDADNRFLSVERFWEALWSLVEHPSSVPGDVPSAPSHLPRMAKQAVVRPAVVSVPKQPRPPRSWNFVPFWPFAPKQAVARPATVSIAKYRRTPRPSIPAVTEQTAEEPAPVSVAEQPPSVTSSKSAIPEQVVEESIPALVTEQLPPILPSEPAATEQGVEESTSALVAEQPPSILPSEPVVAERVVEELAPLSVVEQQHIAPTLESAMPEQVIEEAVPTIEPSVAEQVDEETASALVAEQPPPVLLSEPAVPEQAVPRTGASPASTGSLAQHKFDDPASPANQSARAHRLAIHDRDAQSSMVWAGDPVWGTGNAPALEARLSVPKKPRALHAWKLVVLLIVLVSVIGLGISADISSHVFTRLAASATSTPSSFRPTPTPVPTTYPTLAGTYKGTIFDIPVNVRTSLTFTDVRQNQGHISGYLTVGPGLLGYGPFSGTIDTAKHLQFTVTDADGNPTLFFEGAMQSATSLSGDYYRCNPAQGSPCVRGPVGYGIWNVLASSSSGTSTGTNPSPSL